MDTLPLPDELLLLAYEDDGTTWAVGDYLEYGLAAALLLELALAGRIDLQAGKMHVVDPTATGDPLVDATRERLSAERPREPRIWIPALARGSRRPVLDRLVEAGVLRREAGKVLRVLPVTRYPAAAGDEPVAETDVRRRMLAAIDGADPVEPRTAALCGLVNALGWEQQVFPDRPLAATRTRTAEIAGGSWANEAVRQAVLDVHQAVLVAVAVVVVSAASG